MINVSSGVSFPNQARIDGLNANSTTSQIIITSVGPLFIKPGELLSTVDSANNLSHPCSWHRHLCRLQIPIPHHVTFSDQILVHESQGQRRGILL